MSSPAFAQINEILFGDDVRDTIRIPEYERELFGELTTELITGLDWYSFDAYGSERRTYRNENMFPKEGTLSSKLFNLQFEAVGVIPSIQMLWARKEGYDGDSSFVIAVVDTGIDFPGNEYDLAGREWINEDEIYGNGIDDDENGYVDDRYGYDFYYETADTTHLYSKESQRHGLNMATTIAAKYNNECVDYRGLPNDDPERYKHCAESPAGMDQRSKIMNVKIGGEGDDDRYVRNMAEGIRYATDNGAKVINVSIMSLRTGSRVIREEFFEEDTQLLVNEELESALQYAWDQGALVVTGSGNLVQRKDLKRSEYNTLAAHPTTLAVGGIKSGSGMVKDDWFAMAGENVDVVTFSKIQRNTRHQKIGTSYASAIVSSMASLLWANDASLTNAEVKEIIIESAWDGLTNFLPDTVEYWKVFNGFVALEDSVIDWSRGGAVSIGDTIQWDTPGHDIYHGYGFVRIPEVMMRHKNRDVTVDPVTGSVNGYVMRTTLDTAHVTWNHNGWTFEPYVEPLSTEEREWATIYPNPCRDVVTLSPSIPGETVELISVDGRIRKELIINNYNQLLVMGLDRGLYLVRFRDQVYKLLKE